MHEGAQKRQKNKNKSIRNGKHKQKKQTKDKYIKNVPQRATQERQPYTFIYGEQPIYSVFIYGEKRCSTEDEEQTTRVYICFCSL